MVARVSAAMLGRVHDLVGVLSSDRAGEGHHGGLTVDRSGCGTIKEAVGSGQVLGWPLFLGQLRSLMVTRPDSCAGGVRSRSAPSRPPTSASSKTSCSPELYQATQTGRTSKP